MKLIKKVISALFAFVLLFSATTTSSFAIDKLHFVIGGVLVVVGMELQEELEKL